MYHINQRYAQVLTVAAAAKTIALHIAAIAVCLCDLAIELGKACRPARPHIRRFAITCYNQGRRFRRYIDQLEVQLNDAVFASHYSAEETEIESIESLTEIETVFWAAAAATFCFTPVHTEPQIFPAGDSPAANYTIRQLKEIAKTNKLPRYSTMTKAQLLEALSLA